MAEEGLPFTPLSFKAPGLLAAADFIASCAWRHTVAETKRFLARAAKSQSVEPSLTDWPAQTGLRNVEPLLVQVNGSRLK